MRNSLLFSAAIVAIYAMAVLGARESLDINSPDVQWLGRWAVGVHVKQANDGIKFNKVLRAELDEKTPIDAVVYLLIDATNRDGKDAKFLHERVGGEVMHGTPSPRQCNYGMLAYLPNGCQGTCTLLHTGADTGSDEQVVGESPSSDAAPSKICVRSDRVSVRAPAIVDGYSTNASR